MKRNAESLQQSAEATSLGRAMRFNRPVVTTFVSNLKTIYEKYQLSPSQVFNVDKPAVTIKGAIW